MKLTLILMIVAAACSTPPLPAADDGTTTTTEACRTTAPRRCAGHYGPCPNGEYCRERKVGQCPNTQHFGFCAVQPVRCQAIFKPVCGCDGLSYTNACQAAGAGVAVAGAGTCRP